LFLLARAAGAAEALAPNLEFIGGPVNGARVTTAAGDICIYGDPRSDAPPAAAVLFTHSRRDAAWAGRALVERGAAAVVPAGDAGQFADAEAFWARFAEARFHDYAQVSSKVLVKNLPAAKSVRGGDELAWGDATFKVLDTPGPTRGSVTYLLERGGRKIAFPGDLIREDGRIADLFSLQDAIPEAKIRGYHGWAARLADVVSSLETLAGAKPDLLVPARGPVIRDPAPAIARLIARIRAVYANYLSVDALRWYFGDEHIRVKAKRVLGPGTPVRWMPMAETRPLPPWIVAVANSRLIVAADGSGFLVDCGGKDIVADLRSRRDAGTLRSLEGVFVSHYHDDHTDALPLLVDTFRCPIHAVGGLIDVLERPGDYRLPCLTKNAARVGRRHRHGDSWRWKEFRMTAWDFPGQTLWHDALLVERDGGEKMLFAGDSFTPSGIDDYCLQNRNFLRDGAGYFRCLDLLETLPRNTWMINQHVAPAFRFSPEATAHMRATLKDRVDLLRDLLPWDDPNFGLDEGWVRVEPYSVRARASEEAAATVKVMNHSPRTREFAIRLRAPQGWAVEPAGAARMSIPGGREGEFRFRIRPAPGAGGTHVITADVSWEGGELIEWAEAMVEVRR
jgi:glyoxylase-like metal-dependent hydrolase (beta-lactamase superfamily II)